MLATLIAMGPVAALGGPLLGVAVARWAPFRGSALIGVVTLVFLTALPSESASPWRLLSAWPILVDEHVNNENGPVVRSNFVPDVEPIWALLYLLCLCGLAVVAALLRDPGHRRPLLIAGAAPHRRCGRMLPPRRGMSALTRLPRPVPGSAAAAVALVLTAAALPGDGVSPFVTRMAELVLAGGAAYLLDDAAAPLTEVTPPAVWRRRAPVLLVGAGLLASAWLVVLGVLRWQDSLPTALLPTIEVVVLSLLALAAAAIGVRRGEPEPGGQVAPLVGVLGIGALIADFLLRGRDLPAVGRGRGGGRHRDGLVAGRGRGRRSAIIVVAARDPGEPLREPVGEVTTPTKHGFRVRMTRMGLTSPPSLTSG